MPCSAAAAAALKAVIVSSPLATAVSTQLASSEPIPLYNPLAPLAQPEKPGQPYKALDSFGWQDAAIFNGRSDHAQRLGRRILAHPLTVLYGESGSGKTSLLQAGVLPWLAQRHTLLTVAQPAPSEWAAISTPGSRSRNPPTITVRIAAMREISSLGLNGLTI